MQGVSSQGMQATGLKHNIEWTCIVNQKPNSGSNNLMAKANQCLKPLHDWPATFV